MNQTPEQNKDHDMGLEIEQFLTSMSDIIDRMTRACDGSTTQEAVLQRYRELHFDFSSEF